MLSKIMNLPGNVIHHVTDEWLNPSIKDNEHKNRESNRQNYEIKNPNQKHPSN